MLRPAECTLRRCRRGTTPRGAERGSPARRVRGICCRTGRRYRHFPARSGGFSFPLQVAEGFSRYPEVGTGRGNLPTTCNEGGSPLPRPGVGTENPPDSPGERYRRPVRRNTSYTTCGDPALRATRRRARRHGVPPADRNIKANYRKRASSSNSSRRTRPLPAQRGPRHVARRDIDLDQGMDKVRETFQISDQTRLKSRAARSSWPATSPTPASNRAR